MAKYWSASSSSIWDSAICDASAMPSDKVAITDSEYSGLMAKQAQGYKIVNNTSTGKPQAIAQGLTNATRTVQALDSEVVHKTGAETVAGVKTFTDSPKVERVNPYVDIVQTDIKKGTAPSATSYAGVRFGGSEGAADDDKQMGALLHNYYANGANIMRLQVNKPEAGSTETASLTVAYSGAGDAYASAPTPVNEDDNSTKVATTEWVKKKADKYLPLAGGKMTGNIIGNRDEFTILQNSDAKSTIIRGGTAYASGASLVLFGKDNENAGIFRAIAHDGTNINNFLLYPSGSATIGGKNVITSNGGQIDGTFRANTEGFVTGVADDDSVRMSGGTGWNNGASVVVYGMNHASYPGAFRAKACDGTNERVLLGKSDGTLTWNGKDVITSAGGTIIGNMYFGSSIAQRTDSAVFDITGGTTWEKGAYLSLSGKDSNRGGRFDLVAKDETRESVLRGTPDGTLTWAGKEVERVVTTQTNSYGMCIRYASGIQIYFGGAPSNNTTISFPLPFVSKPRFSLGQTTGTGDLASIPNVIAISATTISCKVRNVIAGTWDYDAIIDVIAIGYWK